MLIAAVFGYLVTLDNSDVLVSSLLAVPTSSDAGANSQKQACGRTETGHSGPGSRKQAEKHLS